MDDLTRIREWKTTPLELLEFGFLFRNNYTNGKCFNRIDKKVGCMIFVYETGFVDSYCFYDVESFNGDGFLVLKQFLFPYHYYGRPIPKDLNHLDHLMEFEEMKKHSSFHEYFQTLIKIYFP